MKTKQQGKSTLVLGLPKGSLQDATFLMMKKAGFSVSVGSRSYIPSIDDPELQGRLVRARRRGQAGGAWEKAQRA